MIYIVSDLLVARDLEKSITDVAKGIALKQVTTGKGACKNVTADEDCDSCYEKGRSFVICLKEHMGNAGSYILQIGEALDKADQAAVSAVKTNGTGGR